MKRYMRNKLAHDAQRVRDYLNSSLIFYTGAKPTKDDWNSWMKYLEHKYITESFAELGKDARDTVKPFKSFYTYLRDLVGDTVYSFWGLKNMVVGIGMLVASPVIAYRAMKHAGYNPFQAVASALAMAITPFLTGAIQFIVSPFIPLRMLPRLFLNILNNSGENTLFNGRIEESKTVRQIVDEYTHGQLQTPCSFNVAYNTLREKVVEGRNRLGIVAGDENELRALLRPATGAEDAQAKKIGLFNFFAKSIEARKALAAPRAEVPATKVVARPAA